MKKPLSCEAEFLVILLRIFIISSRHLLRAYSVLEDKQVRQVKNLVSVPKESLALYYGLLSNFTKNLFYCLTWGTHVIITILTA